MNWLDIVIVVILAYSIIMGLRRGFIRAIAGLVGLMVGIILGALWFPFGGSLLIDLIPNSNAASVISFAAIALVVYMLVILGMRLLDKLVGLTPVSLVNRLAGGLVAFLKIIQALLMFQVLITKFPFPPLDAAVKESEIMNFVSGLAPVISVLLDLLPVEF